MILASSSRSDIEAILTKAISMALDFRTQKSVRRAMLSTSEGMALLDPLPDKGCCLQDVLTEFQHRILPYCTNFNSPNFLGFPDAGNSAAGMTGALLSALLQQNLINQDICAPSATFCELAVLRWLRQIVGYSLDPLETALDAGGIITTGGTSSNTIALLLARERKCPGTMSQGITNPQLFGVIVPKGIGHYSVKSAQMWLGCGTNLIEVETDNFRYNQDDLLRQLKKHKGHIMSLVAYAGDSRTTTIEHLRAVYDIAKSVDPSIWLHVDACHGFCLGASPSLASRLDGINLFDSISTDPHKVLDIPYVLSALLVREPSSLRSILSFSDLIMQEPFALGQLTPFYGSRAWDSLKLWFLIKNLGREGIAQIIEERHRKAFYLYEQLRSSGDFIAINKPDLNAVAFLYRGSIAGPSIETINFVSKAIYQRLRAEGKFYLHQFSLLDPGVFTKGAVLYPLRYMSGNSETNERTIAEMMNEVRHVGLEVEQTL